MNQILTHYLQVEKLDAIIRYFLDRLLKPVLWIFSIFLVSGVSCWGGDLGIEITDFSGKKMNLVSPPNKIITLIPSLGELVAVLLEDSQDRIVGVSEFSDFPEGLKKIKSVGPYTHVNVELIASLKPDLIFASMDGNSQHQVQHLRELGLSVVVVGTENFLEIKTSMVLVAKCLGFLKRGEELVRRFEEGLHRIRLRKDERLEKIRGKKVLIQLGSDPLVVVGKRSFLNEAVEFLGAHNSYSEISSHYPRPSIEDVIQKNPEVIVALAFRRAGAGGIAGSQAWLKEWTRFPTLNAVKAKNLKVIEGDALLRPTLRLLDGLQQLENAIYAN